MGGCECGVLRKRRRDMGRLGRIQESLLMLLWFLFASLFHEWLDIRVSAFHEIWEKRGRWPNFFSNEWVFHFGCCNSWMSRNGEQKWFWLEFLGFLHWYIVLVRLNILDFAFWLIFYMLFFLLQWLNCLMKKSFSS